MSIACEHTGGKWGIFHSFRIGTFWTFRSKKIHLFLLSKPSNDPNYMSLGSQWTHILVRAVDQQTALSRRCANVGAALKMWAHHLKNTAQPAKHCQPPVMSISKINTLTALAQHSANVASQSTAVDSACLPAKQGFEPHLPSVARLKLSTQLN